MKFCSTFRLKGVVMKKWSISGVKIQTPDNVIKKGNIVINGSAIDSVSARAAETPLSVEPGETVVVPGLINAHDHLLGTYYPKIGNPPYINWLPWDNDLKSSPLYEERQHIENRDLYMLGAYRNLVSGVTTVSDHIPHFVAEPHYDYLPTKVIRDYALAHSVTSFALAWGDGIPVEYKKAEEGDIPFVTHIAEGFDEETVRDVDTIIRLGGLGPYSLFIHCIAFSEKDMKKVKDAGASCVWCGDSNMFMYNETADVRMMLQSGINMSIGTDSSATGGLNLLYEMKFDKALYRDIYGEELDDELILKMVTENPARGLHQDDIGMIKQGYTADLALFRDTGGTPAESVLAADLKDLRLLVIDGRPVYGDSEFSDLFRSLKVEYQEVVLDGTDKLIIGDVTGMMQRISRAVGFKKEFPFLPVDFDF